MAYVRDYMRISPCQCGKREPLDFHLDKYNRIVGFDEYVAFSFNIRILVGPASMFDAHRGQSSPYESFCGIPDV